MEHARASTHRTGGIVAVALLVAIVGITASDAHGRPAEPSGAPPGAYRFRSAEKCFMRKINRKRARRGLRRLRWDKHLGYVARRHAARMAQARTVWHDWRLGRRVTRWLSLGQNTGEGGECGPLFRRFWRSRPHRANILGRFRFVGVGTKRKHGRLYVQQVFEFRSNPGNAYGYP